MKKFLLILTVLAAYCSAYAQDKDYKVVFDMSTGDSISQQTVIRQVGAISKGDPEAKLAVVIFGQGLNMVVKDRTQYAAPISQLLNNKNVSFKVCAATLKRLNVDPAQLIPGVEIVKDGIYEIITKQREGWGYIKVAQ